MSDNEHRFTDPLATTEHRFIGALATNALVGRDHELLAIEQALHPSNGVEFQVFAFVAEGGFGKTRLLQQTYTWIGGKPIQGDPLNNPPRDLAPRWAQKHLVCLPLIDVADPLLHRQVAFLRQLRKNFGYALRDQQPLLSDQAVFSQFDTALETYQVTREQGASYTEIQQATNALAEGFERDYKKLTGSYRIVWLIDTVEQLYDIREEIADTLDNVDLKEDEIEQTTYHWLLDFIGHKASNTVLLLSGRPQPSRWINDLETRPQVKRSLRRFDLKKFTAEEIGLYFSQLSQQLADEGHLDESIYLEDMLNDPERLQVMYYLTDGNPIRLALYIDMVTSSSEEPDEFNQEVSAIQNQSPDSLEILRQQVDDHILDYIENGIGHPDNAFLRYLLVTRRGLNAKRLHALTTKPLEECQAILDHLNRLSFVKTRYTKVFLHDELYAIHSRRLARKRTVQPAEYAARQRDLNATYSIIIDYCQRQVQETISEIAAIQSKYMDNPVYSVEDRALLRELRQKKPRYLAEILHYQLYRDAKTGFYDRYYILAEQAFMGRDIDLDGYLQSEINVFFFGAAAQPNQSQAGLDNAAWRLLCLDVEEERTVRWIKRITQFGKLNRAQRFAEQIQHNYERIIASIHAEAITLRQQQFPLAQPQQLFNLEAEAYRCFAAILKGDPIGSATLPKTLDDLAVTIKFLRAATQAELFDPLARTRWLNTIAQCHSHHGYGHVLSGSFRLAQRSYRDAKNLAREIGHEALQAEINNNYSRIVGELGRFHDAVAYCEEGETVRRKFGFDYLVALSLNTLSLINTRNDRPTPGINPAKQALSLFHQINNARGIVMASKQLAEAYRRAWLFNPQSEKHFNLKEAEKLLREALPMVTSSDPKREPVVNEKVRYIEIYQELGSLYRDRLLAEDVNNTAELLTQALDFLEKARERAAEANLLTYEVDAILNKAYAYYYAGDLQAANQQLDNVVAIIPQQYLLSEQSSFEFHDDANLAIFYLLSKLTNLCALIDTKEHPDRLLEHRIIGATYSQLFSKDSWYFGIHKSQVQKLIDTDTFDSMNKRLEQANSIIDRYHLRNLQHSDFGEPEVIRIINELTAAQKSDAFDF